MQISIVVIVVIVVKFHIVFLAGSSHLRCRAADVYIYIYSAMCMIEVNRYKTEPLL